MLHRIVRVLKRVDNNIQRKLRTASVKKVDNQPLQLTDTQDVTAILEEVNFYDTTTLREIAILSTSRFKKKTLNMYMKTRIKGASTAHHVLHNIREIKKRLRP